MRTATSSTSSCPANPGLSAPLALSSKDHPARQDRKDRLARRASKARWVPKVHRATPVSPGLKGLLASLDRRVPLVTLDQLASEARRDRRATSDHPVPLALTELLALRDLRARRVVLDHRGQRVILALPASTAGPDHRGSPDRKVTLEMRDLRAYPEAADRRDRKASRESRAFPENRDPRAFPVQRVQPGRVFRQGSS